LDLFLNTMKILHVVPTYYPAVRYGGPIYVIRALCSALVAAGHEVRAFTTSVDGPGDSNVTHGRPVDLDGVQVHYFRSRWLRRFYYSTELARQLRTMISDFDVVHLHSVFLFPTWAGARAAARAKVPYVLSPRGMLVRDLIKQRSTVAKRVWIQLIERSNLARANRIHLTSEEERRALIDLELAMVPTTVIPNGVDLPTPFSADAVSEDVRALVADGFDILCFGRINWKKGLDRLIYSLPEIRDARLLVAGNDENGLTVKLRKIACESGVGNRVRFLPRQIAGPDKEALFAAARILVLPSISENFGNVIPEAMIRSLPVVVTERVGAAEMVQASGSGVVAQGHDGLPAAIANLLESNGRLASMGAAGVRYAREHLSWRRVAQLFEAMYSEICRRDLELEQSTPACPALL
jgi:glycosyltransferase involved in cell wall biosynthesis